MHQANAVTRPVETPHDAMDSVADWAADHPMTHPATRRPYIPLGCDQQGHLTPTKQVQRPVASNNATDPADDFSDADTIFWRYAMAGLAVWTVAISLVIFAR